MENGERASFIPTVYVDVDVVSGSSSSSSRAARVTSDVTNRCSSRLRGPRIAVSQARTATRLINGILMHGVSAPISTSTSSPSVSRDPARLDISAAPASKPTSLQFKFKFHVKFV